MAFMAAFTSFLYCLQRTCLLFYLQDSLGGPRQTVELPSQNEMEDDECENANEGAWRERIDQQDRCRYDPNHPEPHAHPAKTLAKGRDLSMATPRATRPIGTSRSPTTNNASNMPSVACHMRTSAARSSVVAPGAW